MVLIMIAIGVGIGVGLCSGENGCDSGSSSGGYSGGNSRPGGWNQTKNCFLKLFLNFSNKDYCMYQEVLTHILYAKFLGKLV